MNGLALGMTGLWRWWTGELAGLLPLRLRDALGLPLGKVAVQVSAERITLAGEGQPDEVVPRDDLDQWAMAPPLWLKKAVQRRAQVALVIDPQDVFRRRVMLPAAARWRLRQILSLDLDRLSPVPPERVLFDGRVAAVRDNRVVAELLLVKRETVERGLDLCRSIGLTATEVVITPGRPLLTLPRSPASLGTVGRLTIILAILVTGLAAANIWRDAAARESAAAALATEVGQAKKAAAAAERLRGEVMAARQGVTFLARRKQAPMLAALVAEMTGLLPDDTWLFSLERTGNELRLKGHSRAASGLVERLGHSTAFTNAQFRAPLTQSGRGDMQRFDLSVDIR